MDGRTESNKVLDGSTTQGRETIFMLAAMGHKLEYSFERFGIHWHSSNLNEGKHKFDEVNTDDKFYRIKQNV
jgi:hypothetical protein